MDTSKLVGMNILPGKVSAGTNPIMPISGMVISAIGRSRLKAWDFSFVSQPMWIGNAQAVRNERKNDDI
jgi:hypothetical protein